MSQEVLAILEVIGNHVRTQILHLLSEHPRTALGLAADMDVSHSQVHRHLGVLEDFGLVVADTEAGSRRGKPVVWVTDTERIAALGAIWTAYSRGE